MMVEPRTDPLEKVAAFVSQRARWAALVLSVLFMVVAALLLTGLTSLFDAPGAAASAASAFAAGAAVFFAAWQFGQQDASQRSKFALDMAMDGVQRTYAIINVPGIATRIQWVNAGRVMARATQTSKNITAADHRDAWDQFREEWRIKFYHFLTRSPEYYLGLEEPADFDPNKMAYLDDKMIELLKKTEIKSRFAIQNKSGSGTSNSFLSLDSIRPIYDFAQYDEWRDPLDNVEDFTPSEEKSMMNRDMKGLGLTVYALNKWTVTGSKVIERKNIASGDWKPEDVDDED